MRAFAARRADASASASEPTVSSLAMPRARRRPRDRVDDVEEADAPGVERRHGLLVRRVEDRRVLAAGPADLLGERDGRERRRRRAARTSSSCAVVQSSGLARRRDAVRPVEPERDRQAHVGRRGLGDRGSVDELDHRVHDRLRVHDDLDAVVLDVEEQVRLDDLEPLVHERGGVRRDDEPHVPRRMGERLGRGDLGELLAASARGTDRPTP